MLTGIPPEVFGPAGALVLAILVIVGLVKLAMILWKEHLKADQDDRDQRDKALHLLEEAVAGNKSHADANRSMAAAWDARNKADAARKRREDA